MTGQIRIVNILFLVSERRPFRQALEFDKVRLVREEGLVKCEDIGNRVVQFDTCRTRISQIMLFGAS